MIGVGVLVAPWFRDADGAEFDLRGGAVCADSGFGELCLMVDMEEGWSIWGTIAFAVGLAAAAATAYVAYSVYARRGLLDLKQLFVPYVLGAATAIVFMVIRPDGVDFLWGGFLTLGGYVVAAAGAVFANKIRWPTP
jgi:hypothetical protein